MHVRYTCVCDSKLAQTLLGAMEYLSTHLSLQRLCSLTVPYNTCIIVMISMMRRAKTL